MIVQKPYFINLLGITGVVKIHRKCIFADKSFVNKDLRKKQRAPITQPEESVWCAVAICPSVDILPRPNGAGVMPLSPGQTLPDESVLFPTCEVLPFLRYTRELGVTVLFRLGSDNSTSVQHGVWWSLVESNLLVYHAGNRSVIPKETPVLPR